MSDQIIDTNAISEHQDHSVQTSVPPTTSPPPASTPFGVMRRSEADTVTASRPIATATKSSATRSSATKPPANKSGSSTQRTPKLEKGKPVDPAIDKLFPMPAIPAGASEDLQRRAEDLRRWWVNQLLEEWPMMIDKAIKYGGGDLDLMGNGVNMLVGSEGPAGGVEKAVTFYLLGKVSRLLGAFERKLRPTRDSWVDAHVYSMIGMRIHDEGTWF